MKMTDRILKILTVLIFSLFVFSCASDDKLALVEVNGEEAKPKIEYTKDWVKKQNKNVDQSIGSIRLRARKNIGTFNISIVDDMGKTIPCLSTSNEYITTSFYLKSGRRIIKLNEDSCVDSATRKLDNGMQVLYSIDELADVYITFECICPNPDYKGFDSVKITAHVVNKGTKRADFQLKAIFDTVLGETDRHHFYDSNGQPVKNEVAYKKITENDWFVSKNTNASMQFIFAGSEATVPEMVALANYATLDTKYWEPDMLSYRAFDTVLSYNNSAIGAIWKSKKLDPDNGFDNIFYICTAYGKDEPQGKYLLKNKGNASKPDTEEDDDDKVKQDSQKPGDKAAEKPVEKPAEEKPQSGVKPGDNDDSQVAKPSETVTDKPAEKTEYSKEYIQKLLDRIAALEDDGENVDNEELIRLNMELDQILKSYRK